MKEENIKILKDYFRIATVWAVAAEHFCKVRSTKWTLIYFHSSFEVRCGPLNFYFLEQPLYSNTSLVRRLLAQFLVRSNVRPFRRYLHPRSSVTLGISTDVELKIFYRYCVR